MTYADSRGLQTSGHSVEVLSSEEEEDIERACMPSSLGVGEIGTDIFDAKVIRNCDLGDDLGDCYVSQGDVHRFVRQSQPGPCTLQGLFLWPERFLDTIKAHDQGAWQRFLDNMRFLGLHTTYTGVDAPGYAISSLIACILGKYGIDSQWSNMMGWEMEDFDFALF